MLQPHIIVVCSLTAYNSTLKPLVWLQNWHMFPAFVTALWWCICIYSFQGFIFHFCFPSSDVFTMLCTFNQEASLDRSVHWTGLSWARTSQLLISMSISWDAFSKCPLKHLLWTPLHWYLSLCSNNIVWAVWSMVILKSGMLTTWLAKWSWFWMIIASMLVPFDSRRTQIFMCLSSLLIRRINLRQCWWYLSRVLSGACM